MMANTDPSAARNAAGSAHQGSTVAVPGVLFVGQAGANPKYIVQIGAGVGWIPPAGISEWEREVSVVLRSDVTDAARQQLGLKFPEEHVDAAKHPLTHKAAGAAPLIAIPSNMVEKLIAQKVRVHTIGFDRISGGIYYFAEGGDAEPVRVQGGLVEMITPALKEGNSNADVEACLEGFIDRLLAEFSNNILSEVRLELADALPRLAPVGKGTVDVDVDAFERKAAALSTQSSAHESNARTLVDALGIAARRGEDVAKIPLYGEARRETQPDMQIQVGDKTLVLPARARWFVSGQIVETETKAAEPASSERARPAATMTAPATPVAMKQSGPEPRPEAPRPSSPSSPAASETARTSERIEAAAPAPEVAPVSEQPAAPAPVQVAAPPPAAELAAEDAAATAATAVDELPEQPIELAKPKAVAKAKPEPSESKEALSKPAAESVPPEPPRSSGTSVVLLVLLVAAVIGFVLYQLGIGK